MSILYPFDKLSDENRLGEGAAGFVFGINNAIALKIAVQVKCNRGMKVGLQRLWRRVSEDSITALDREKRVYKWLIDVPHKNVLHGILLVPEGIFMERIATTLFFRCRIYAPGAITTDLKQRWSKEVAEGAAWIERHGLAHGNLCPENAFLDCSDHIKLGVFDAAVMIGEEVTACKEPYWLDKPDQSLKRAGPKSEQFAIGSILYFILTHRRPEIKTEGTQIEDICYPDVSNMKLGPIISGCWAGVFPSVVEVARLVTAACPGVQTSTAFMCTERLSELRQICRTFVDEHRKSLEPPADL